MRKYFLRPAAKYLRLKGISSPKKEVKPNHIYAKSECAKKRRYQQLFADSDVLGFDYEARSPREAKEKFAPYFDFVFKNRKSATIVANGIGAFLP